MKNNMKTKLKYKIPWYVISKAINYFREQEQLHDSKGNLAPLDTAS